MFNQKGIQILKLLVLFFVPVILEHDLFAQTNSTLRVVVTDEGGDPLTGANVLLYLEGETELEEYCVTSVNGFCEFNRLRPRTYKMRISFLGFKTFEKLLILREDDIRVERIELLVDVEQLGEIVVEEERGFTTGGLGITRVEAEDLGRVPSVSLDGDLMAYIRTVPGVVSIGDSGGDLYIRGGTPAQNIVLVDDLPIIKPFHISNLFSAFPEPVVNNIDVLAGGFDARYMSSTSAVIDVNLKSGDMSRYSGSGSLSPYISSIFLEGPVEEKKSSFLVSGRASTVKSFSGYLGTEARDIEFYDLVGRYSINGDDFMCNATALITDDQGRISEVSEAYLSWTNTGIGMRCFGFGGAFALPFEASIGHTTFENREVSSEGTNNRSSVKQTFMRLDFQDNWLGHKFDFGLQILVHTVETKIDQRFAVLDIVGRERRYPMYQLYIKSDFNVSERVKVITSLGSQANVHFSPTVEPRVRIITKPFASQNSELSFAFGRYFQAIDGFSDQRDAGTSFTIYRASDSVGRLFESIHRIAGLKHKFGSRFTVNVEGYYMNHTGVPVARWTPVAQVFVEPVRANSKSYGFNTSLEYQLKPLFISVNYGYSDVTYESRSESLGAWIDQEVFTYSPPHDQTHQLNTLFSAEIEKFKFNLIWELGTGKPYTQVFGFDLDVNVPNVSPTENPGVARTLYSEPFGSRLPYYHRLDVSIQRSFDISEGITFETELGCLNAYDRNNVFYVDLNTLERVDQTAILPYLAAKISFK
ncbi:MAG: TonB-dependent receptor [Balneola sp.]|nr:MAG: TonB-dependent receptor [Balneola sp.]